MCGGQGSETRKVASSKSKRKAKEFTIMPSGNSKGKSKSSRALASKRERAKRLTALVKLQKHAIDHLDE